MTELKAFRIIQGDTGGYGAPSYKCDTDGNRIEEWSDACEVYDRFEADKVIAEMDAEIEELKEQVHDYTQGLCVMQARAEKEARHHKYKRCLAMAGWCRARYSLWPKIFSTEPTRKMKFLDKWEKRWLELAKVFKEAK